MVLLLILLKIYYIFGFLASLIAIQELRGMRQVGVAASLGSLQQSSPELVILSRETERTLTECADDRDLCLSHSKRSQSAVALHSSSQ